MTHTIQTENKYSMSELFFFWRNVIRNNVYDKQRVKNTKPNKCSKTYAVIDSEALPWSPDIQMH